MTMDLLQLLCPYLLRGSKNTPDQEKPLYRLIDSYCIIIFHFYFIISGIVLVFVLFLGTVLCSDL